MIIAIIVVIIITLLLLIILINNNVNNNGNVIKESSHLIEEILFKVILKIFMLSVFLMSLGFNSKMKDQWKIRLFDRCRHTHINSYTCIYT